MRAGCGPGLPVADGIRDRYAGRNVVGYVGADFIGKSTAGNPGSCVYSISTSVAQGYGIAGNGDIQAPGTQGSHVGDAVIVGAGDGVVLNFYKAVLVALRVYAYACAGACSTANVDGVVVDAAFKLGTCEAENIDGIDAPGLNQRIARNVEIHVAGAAGHQINGCCQTCAWIKGGIRNIHTGEGSTLRYYLQAIGFGLCEGASW